MPLEPGCLCGLVIFGRGSGAQQGDKDSFHGLHHFHVLHLTVMSSDVISDWQTLDDSTFNI